MKIALPQSWKCFLLAHEGLTFWRHVGFTGRWRHTLFLNLNSPKTAYSGVYSICDHSHAEWKDRQWRRCWVLHSDVKAQRGMCSRARERCHINKGYDCCRRQTDMARRYPDDDPLRRLSSHSVALTVGLSVQRHHQHEIPARTQTSETDMTTIASTGS